MSEKVKNELNEVFRSVFDNPNIQITDKTTSDDIVGWDSFSHMNLIATVEMHFGIEFSQSEAVGFQNVGELIEAIDRKLAGG